MKNVCDSGKFNFQNKRIYKPWLSIYDQYKTDGNRPCNSFVPTLAFYVTVINIWWVTQPEIDDEHVQLILFIIIFDFYMLKGSHRYQRQASLQLINEVHVGTTNDLLWLLLFLIIILIGFIGFFIINISFLDSHSKT